MREKLPGWVGWIFDGAVAIGVLFIAWGATQISALNVAQGKDDERNIAIDRRLTGIEGRMTEAEKSNKRIEENQEKFRGEMKVGRQIDCMILHEIKPGAPCPAVEDSD